MTPTYDKPLLLTVAMPGETYDFATGPVTEFPAAIASVKGPLRCAQVYGISGVVVNSGVGTLNIGTLDDPDRYGTFTIKAGLSAGASLVGELVLTEEGFRMGLDNDAAVVERFAVSKADGGTIVVSGLRLVVGYFY